MTRRTMRKPDVERAHPAGMGGVQRLYRFENGYGASVVRAPFTYGSSDGLWELAVIEFVGDSFDEFSLTYDTDVTDDVEGHLNEVDVDRLLSQIEAL